MTPDKRPKIQVHRPDPREIRPRDEEPGAPPTAAPKRRLIVPPKGPKPPPGGGWRRTPNGWARGQGHDYEWQPLNWADKGPKQGKAKGKTRVSPHQQAALDKLAELGELRTEYHRSHEGAEGVSGRTLDALHRKGLVEREEVGRGTRPLKIKGISRDWPFIKYRWTVKGSAPKVPK